MLHDSQDDGFNLYVNLDIGCLQITKENPLEQLQKANYLREGISDPLILAKRRLKEIWYGYLRGWLG